MDKITDLPSEIIRMIIAQLRSLLITKTEIFDEIFGMLGAGLSIYQFLQASDYFLRVASNMSRKGQPRCIRTALRLARTKKQERALR